MANIKHRSRANRTCRSMNGDTFSGQTNINPQQPNLATAYGQYPSQMMMMSQAGGNSAPVSSGYGMNMPPGYGMQGHGFPPSGPPVMMGGGNNGGYSIGAIPPPDGPEQPGGEGLEGGAGDSSKLSKSKKRKKPKDKPKRPLSAYNLFFQEERSKILQSIPRGKKEVSSEDSKSEKDAGQTEEEKENTEAEEGGEAESDEAKKLQAQGKKRPHGKIGFEDLAKTIGKRWKEISPERLARFTALADKDTERYKKEMEVYSEKIEHEKSRQKVEAEDIHERMLKIPKDQDYLLDDETRKKMKFKRGNLDPQTVHSNQQFPGGYPIGMNPVSVQQQMQSGMPPGVPNLGNMPSGMSVNMPVQGQQGGNASYNYPLAPDQGQPQQVGSAGSGAPSNYGMGPSSYPYSGYPNYGYGAPMYSGYNNGGGASAYGGLGWQQNVPGNGSSPEGAYNGSQHSMQMQSPGTSHTQHQS